jgi:hypothetical protein
MRPATNEKPPVGEVALISSITIKPYPITLKVGNEMAKVKACECLVQNLGFIQ